jgi:ATP/maltotriose-dependent transcriptional regulator MalT/DNA-binding SARP family transcriptional activator
MTVAKSHEMRRPNFFLRTKLLPPRTGSDLLERPRLTQKLEANLDSTVTMVAADAGCGKTTLGADFLRSQSRPSVWYQMDHTDADPAAFLSYVAYGIREFAPEFGQTLIPYVSNAGEELLEFPERAADLLINEILETIEQPFILVLDDYHHIGRETIVHRFVDRMVQYSSELVHLIITTRDLPPLTIIRRKTQANALIITRDDLLFTDEEVKELFRSTLNVELAGDEIAEYRSRTHGWITALQLVRQVAEQDLHSPDADKKVDLLNALRQSEKDIFDYFAEEVFSREPEATQNLLLYLSLLDPMPLDDCSRLFPDLRCSAVLPELSQNNVFVTAAGDGGRSEEYRFHPLFRDFLRRRLRSVIGRAAVANERDRIAGAYADAGEWQKAMPFLLDAENFEAAAKLLSERGEDWLSSGANETLRLYAERIPVSTLEKHPRAMLHLAEVSRIRGEIEKCNSLLRTAVKSLRKQNDAAGEAEALHALASLARRRGNIGESLNLLDEAEKLADDSSETAVKCANTRGLCLVSEGKWAEAEQQFRFALDLAERQANQKYIRLITHNLALPAGFRGDFGAALEWFRRIFRNSDEDRPLPQEAIGHLNISRLHLYRGELADAERHLERSLELCQLFGMKSLLAEIFEAYGNFYRESGDLAHAGEYYERSLKAYEDAEVNIATRELNEERSRFYMLQGDTKRARTLITRLIQQREPLNNSVSLDTARLCLAQIDLTESKTAGLTERVQELVEHFQAENHYYDECLAAMLMAEVTFEKDKTGDALPYIGRVLDLSARFDYDHWLRQQIRRRPDIFSIEEVVERLPFDLSGEISSAAPAAESTEVVAIEQPSSLTDLTINVLGPVEIFRDPTKPFAADAWTTRRARDIFCCIATSKYRRVSKDILIDLFWPDEDPAVVEKNFHPTISHIRKALNSRQPFKQNFILFRDGAYQLNPELSIVIDAEEFDRHFAEAEMAKREKNNEQLRVSLEAAHKCYRGEFMQGIYDDWAEERRTFYSEQFGRVTSALARLELAEKRLASAKKYAEETLTVDPYREDIHRLVLKIHAAQGKPAAVKKHYESMQELLKKDLGIEPSAETRRLAAELLK